MAHFMAGCKGSGQSVTRLAGKLSMPKAFVNGWHLGGRVVGHHDEKTGKDWFDVYGTGGSNGAGSEVFIGTIEAGKDGKPKFKKAK